MRGRVGPFLRQFVLSKTIHSVEIDAPRLVEYLRDTDDLYQAIANILGTDRHLVRHWMFAPAPRGMTRAEVEKRARLR